MNLLQDIKKITILTGAGISQESGIKTFRDQNGLWENHPIEQVASPEGFQRDPELVHDFYNLRREQLHEVKPNPAHEEIAKAEQDFEITIITQNVDDLHERAGSSQVLHMHGELRKIRSLQTGEVKYFEDSVPPQDFQSWRPHIVWFGEMVMEMEGISKALDDCDLYLCIGTSNNVYPAAGFVHHAKDRGVPCIELNYEPTSLSSLYDQSIQGKASEIVPKFFSELRDGK